MADVLRLSEAASLAMHTMVLLAGSPQKLMRTRQIAETLGVSEAHLSKVLQRLVQAGLVESTRGAKGGFLPAEGSGDVTLLQVYECIEGPLKARTCLLEKPVCNGVGCILGDLPATVNARVRGQLARAKLSELAHRATSGKASSAGLEEEAK